MTLKEIKANLFKVRKEQILNQKGKEKQVENYNSTQNYYVNFLLIDK